MARRWPRFFPFILAPAETVFTCVICRAAPHADALTAWLDKGSHGTMDWMGNHVDVRSDLRQLLPGACSVICVADRYDGGPDAHQPGHGRIARYARGRDYHKIM